MKFKIIGLLLLFILFCRPIFADNISFLNDSPLNYFTGEDANLMSANINNALNSTPDGKKSSWKNPATGAWGFAIPSNTTKNGVVCRTLKIFTSASNMTGESTYKFCKMNGEWKYTTR